MDAECQHCRWNGDANELNWMIVEGNDVVGAERVCPECRNADVVLLA
ncbi:hypothetical protein [Halosolutus gelatinilyticus]|nr:hypothetical protein [Halosolutus gelatinilyticus]